jgi:acetyl-CoA acyltransferase
MSKQIQDAYIVAATRTAGRQAQRHVRNVRPDDLLAHVLKSVMAQAPGLDPALIGDVIVGCAMPEAEQGMNVARIGVLLAGLPNNVPGITINRFCSSGSQAVADAANQIRLGQADVMIAAGTESMTVMTNMMGNKVVVNPAVFAHDEQRAIAFGMGLTAEKVAEQWHISREEQDAFAYASHQKACAAIDAGHFKAEITPYLVDEYLPDLKTGEVKHRQRLAEHDEGARADVTVQSLAKLKPVFHAKGSVTPGNASQMSDGAAAVLLVSEKILKQFNLVPLARFCRLCRRRCAARNHGHRPGRGDSQGAQAGRHCRASAGLDRAQRSFRRAGAGRVEGCVARPEQDQPARRRHRPRPSARRDRCHPHRHAGAWPAAYRRQVRHGQHVHRHRHGCRRHFRTAVRERS